ncbi:MAG: AAA family ATPase [Alistipes sp.]|nr:AAA family ATPase [Candidatus Alistipes equi]
MKFQTLTIHNIASIEDAQINFESEPLSSSEVFLITGKTGAGKSTILDAICLALYADTPRLDNTKMQGATQDGERSININDPRQLMRRNTGEAFVKLTFTGSNSIHYEASWSVARARQKPTGNIQPKSWQLKNLDTGHTFGKDDEIKAEIAAAIGLDFRQFCRTTLLAQGEFTRFLNSQDAEKAAILEKITGVDIYSKIGAKVHEITSQKENIWKDAQRCVEGVSTLSDDEILQKNAEISARENEYNKGLEEKNLASEKRVWIERNSKLKGDLEKVEKELCVLLETLESDDVKADDTLLKNWNATRDARSWMGQISQEKLAVKTQKDNLEKLSSHFARILGGRNFLYDEVQKLNFQFDELEKRLSTAKEKSVVYENAQTIAGHLSVIEKGHDLVTEKNGIISKETKLLTDSLRPLLERAKEDEKNARNVFQEEKVKVEKNEEEVRNLNLGALRLKRDQTRDLLVRIDNARNLLNALLETQAQHKKDGEDLEERLTEINSLRDKSTSMDGPINEARIRMETCYDNLQRQKDSVDKFAKTLRAKLHVGDTCPICGQKIDAALPHEEDLSKLVANLEEAYNASKDELKKLEETKRKLEAELGTESKAYERDKKIFDENVNVKNATEKALTACQACGLKDNTTLSALDTLEGDTQLVLMGLEKNIQDGEQKENAVKTERRELEKKRDNLENLQNKVREAEKAVNESSGRIETAEEVIKNEKKRILEAEDTVRELLSDTKWELDWKDDAEKFSKNLLNEANSYNENVSKKQNLSNSLETLQTEKENVSSVIDKILGTIPDWKSVKADVSQKINALLHQTNDLASEVTQAITTLQNSEKSITTYQTKLDDFLSQNETLTLEKLSELNGYTSKQILDIEEKLFSLRREEVSKRTLKENAENKLKEHQQTQPELTEEDTVEFLDERIRNLESALSDISVRKGEILKELSTDKENKERLGQLIDDAKKKNNEYQRWSRLNQLIGDATGNKFRKIAQSYVLTSLIYSANSYMKTLCDRYTLKVTPGTFVISLEDAYQGYASRAASTISGGESFLVSLSLALALSDIGQTLSVDTLFIDEGFGTLSGEPLQCAINTLRSLHTKAGRHVGIISHVDELQERIPVQIQVNQEGNNSSSTVRIVPEV